MRNGLKLFVLITFFSFVLSANSQNDNKKTVTIKYLNAKSKITYDNGLTWKDISKVKIIRPNFSKTSEDGGSTWNYSFSNNTQEQENLDIKTNFTNLSIYSTDFKLIYNEAQIREEIDFKKINSILLNFGKGMYIIVLSVENSNKVFKVQF